MSALVQCASLRSDKAERFGNASINSQPQLGPAAPQDCHGSVGILRRATEIDLHTINAVVEAAVQIWCLPERLPRLALPPTLDENFYLIDGMPMRRAEMHARGPACRD